MTNVLVKIKHDGLTWEETPVYSTLSESDKEAVYKKLQELSNFLRKEVRWEYEDYGQGHYVQPDPTKMSMWLMPTKRQKLKYRRRVM